MRVLIIEDEATIADLVRTVLEEEGFVCAVAASREDLPEAVFDVVVTDLVGAVAYSAAAAREWLQLLASRYDGCPVIVVTAHAGILGDAASLPHARIVMKPFEIDDLTRAIRETRRT